MVKTIIKIKYKYDLLLNQPLFWEPRIDEVLKSWVTEDSVTHCLFRLL